MISALVAVLTKLQIPYVVIGGIASSLLGKPRMTIDSDIVVLLEKEDSEKFIRTMREHGFKITVSSFPKIVARLNRNLPVKLRYTKRFSVDVRLASYSLDKQAILRAKKQLFFTEKISIVHPEDLIVYKLVRFDELDQSDIKSVLLRQKKKLNIENIISSTQKLSEETGNEKILENLSTFLNWFQS